MSADIDLVSDKDKLRIEKEKIQINRNEDDVRNLMKFAGNRRIVHRLLEECGCFQGVFVAGDQGYTTTYNSGRKDIGLYFMKLILSVCPEQYLLMVEEAKALKIQESKEINKPEEN